MLWRSDEIGIPLARQDWGRSFRSTDVPDFRRLNSTGQVPVVIDGDLVLRDSNTIICDRDAAPIALRRQAQAEIAPK